MTGNQTEKGYAPFDLYPYNPSTPPAFAFVALFAILGILHLCVLIPYRSLFPIPLIIGCGMEATAYYFRTLSHDDVRRTLPFIIQNLLLLASPPFLAASLYMSPRRIARALNSEDLVFSPRLVTKLFVLVDVVCFATQVAGAIMSGSEDPTQASQGEVIITAGLVLQIVAFGLFGAWAGALHVRLRRNRTVLLDRREGGVKFERYFCGLYVSGLLFAMRNVTRIVEYRQGGDGEIQSSEVYLYVLDGLVMLAIVVVFAVLHPGRLRYRERKGRMGKGKMGKGGTEGLLMEHCGPQYNHI